MIVPLFAEMQFRRLRSLLSIFNGPSSIRLSFFSVFSVFSVTSVAKFLKVGDRKVHLQARLLLIVCSIAFAAPVFAQSWPARPIRFIVPFAPGGGGDVVGRIEIGRAHV